MLTHGRFVEFCMPDGQYRPALVVRVWSESCAQLQVFTDKGNDGPDPYGLDWFRSSVSLGEVPGTWRHLPSEFVFYSNGTGRTAGCSMFPNDAPAPSDGAPLDLQRFGSAAATATR